ncbi:MAG TPA: DUF3565 domain-containing protein [Gemmatimonadales bacterium]|nr:DUF3565 domain-containing protein [Gemmatimonadales bacterium]
MWCSASRANASWCPGTEPAVHRSDRTADAALREMSPGRRIVGFHQDTEQHWVAELECGHAQHVRHTPPWEVRPWVLTEAGRAERLGTVLPCRLCGEMEKPRGP